MAMIGANLSIPAIAVLKPGVAVPPGPINILNFDFGDAGGLKWYHDANGVLQNNDLGGGFYAYRKDNRASGGSDMSAHYWNGSVWVPGGFLTEPGITNSLTNNTMVDAATGIPGTPPTNWAVDGAENGLQREIVDIGLENGVDYIDIRVFGTTTASSTFYVYMEKVAAILASQGQNHNTSAYLKLAGGSLTGISNLHIRMQEYDAVQAPGSSNNGPAISLTGKLVRHDFSAAMQDAGTASVQPALRFSYADATAVDFTLRIGLPQCEAQAYASSVIKTALAAVARVTDTASIAAFDACDPSMGTIDWTVFSNAPFSGAQWVYRFSDPGAANSIGGYVANDNGVFNYKVAGSTSEIVHSSNYVPGAENKTAMTYDNADSRISTNGTAAEGTRALAGPPVDIDTYTVGTNNVGSSGFSGFIKSLVYRPYRSTDEEIEALSA